MATCTGTMSYHVTSLRRELVFQIGHVTKVYAGTNWLLMSSIYSYLCLLAAKAFSVRQGIDSDLLY